MSRLESRWGLTDIEVSNSSREAALRVVERLTREKEEIAAHWATAIRLAQDNGASLREIANAAKVSPQTVANLRRTRAT
jgi:DNA-binding CsgD family transcriptional regulator